MKFYVLDTNVISFVERLYPPMMRRMAATTKHEMVVTTIVTVGENLGGWLPVCRRARGGNERALAYSRMQQSFDFFRGKTILPFNDVAAAYFNQLRAQKIRISTNDLAIAAITLSVNGTLVTRNTVDFERVPNLVIEDWTK